MRSVCVYCGSAKGALPEYAEAARAMGELLARRGLQLVYGGGGTGMMGAIADAVLAAGGRAIGVIPDLLMDRESAHRGLTEMRVVRTMHERKALMAELSDAFIALPGGLGTLEELFETVTWNQLGYHDKPIGLLDVAGYFDPMLRFLEHAQVQQFVRPGQLDVLLVDTDAERLLDRLDEACARTAAPLGDKPLPEIAR
jgi:uncharacterized protein (TIGR00730 family)